MGRLDRTVAITRPATQSLPLRQGLEARGFAVVDCPAVEIVPARDMAPLDAAIDNLTSYDWLLLTSANAADFFFQRLTEHQKECGVPIVVVGAATAERVQHWNHTPAMQPAGEFRAESILKLFPADMTRKRVLFPRAETARELLPEELRRRGATVDLIALYSTRKNPAGIEKLRSGLEAGNLSCVVFTSPSAAQFTAQILGDSLKPLFKEVAVAVLGPVVREAAEDAGLLVAIAPGRALISDLIDAIDRYFNG